jgi:pimeloyl-ACP methyl ester carboxylesterase
VVESLRSGDVYPMNYSELPMTRYAMSGDVSVAYQTIGDGPINIIAIPGMISHVEFMHEMPGYTAFLQRLSKFARVITFDKRGQGLSDKISGAPTLAWTTCGLFWTQLARNVLPCSDFPRGAP